MFGILSIALLASLPLISCQTADGALRLNGAGLEGRLEIFHQNEWGTVCNHGGSSSALARVACHSLGCGYVGQILGSMGSSMETGRIWIHNIWCAGTEESLANCSVTWDASDCSHYDDIYISCEPPARLVGGNSTTGRLEIRHNSEWGTVCDRVFDDVTAQVACFSLGFGYVGHVVHNVYGDGSGWIWLDDVVCAGYETLLEDCRHSYSWGYTSCNHSNDVAISCTNRTDSKLRLVGSDLDYEGRLEVFRNGVWGTVCDDYFSATDARIACSTLGFGPLVGEFISNLYGSGSGTVIWTVRCNGSETSFSECSFTSTYGYCSHYEDVSISCRSYYTTGSYSSVLRLDGGTSTLEGRLEIYHDGVWGTICDDSFDDTDARVACFSLGYGYVGETLGNRYGPGTGTIWLDDLECIGYETSLDQCSHRSWGSHNCGHYEDVSISCFDNNNLYNGTMTRLVGGSDGHEGRLEVFHSGVWGTVCSYGFDDVDAQVACYSLGFGRVGTSLFGQYGAGTGRVWLSYLACTGKETFIGDCRHNGWGRDHCEHYLDVSISCRSGSEHQLRLVGGPKEGRLEINHGGVWGTICNDAFNDVDAKVACNSLGFGYVGRTLHKRYANSYDYSTPIWLDGVQCTGSETSLDQCQHDGWGVHDCWHSEDVGISCVDGHNGTTTAGSSSIGATVAIAVVCSVAILLVIIAAVVLHRRRLALAAAQSQMSLLESATQPTEEPDIQMLVA